MGWSDSAVRRYVRDAGPLLRELNVLTRCDCTTRNAKRAARLSRRMDELEARIDELEAAEELAALRPELDGNQVIEHLGIEPGRVVGEAMQYLMEVRLDEGLIGDDRDPQAPRRLVRHPLLSSVCVTVSAPREGRDRDANGKVESRRASADGNVPSRNVEP